MSSTNSELRPPEEQVALYKALRDGDLATVSSLITTSNVNHCPFEALWHQPGPDATALHVAVCCLQPEIVKFLLAAGADASRSAGGYSTVQMIDAFDLFASAREQRPQDAQAVRRLLLHAAT